MLDKAYHVCIKNIKYLQQSYEVEAGLKTNCPQENKKKQKLIYYNGKLVFNAVVSVPFYYRT